MNKPAIQPDTVPRHLVSSGVERSVTYVEKDKVPGPLRPGRSLVWLIWFIRLIAVLNLVCTFLHEIPHPLDWLSQWIPFELSKGKHIRMFLVSMLLFILADGLMRGKRVAWILTIAALAFSPFLHIGRIEIWPHILTNMAFIGLLLVHHRYFVARSDGKSIRIALIVCPAMILGLLVFGTIELHDMREETAGDDDWIACFQTASELILVQNTLTQSAQTAATFNFFSILRISGVSIVLIGLILNLRPVLLRRRAYGEDREKAHRLIDLFGRDPFDSYALLPDKRYFFAHEDRVMVPYVLAGNIAVALANPIGAAEAIPAAIDKFARLCHRHDWEPVFYQVTEDLIPHYEAAGFSIFKIGEEAHVRSDEFHLKGNDFQNLRTACNRAHKVGITFRWYVPGRGIDEALEQQLAEVSDAWLDNKHRKEMTFDMGSFSTGNIRQNGAAIAIDSAGKVLAFTTWRPYAQGNGMALDLMRSLPTERNIMDFVLVESILHFRAQGIHDISLGTAPLANTRKSAQPLVAEEKVVEFLYENLNRIYGYKSLFEFKRKYRPQWRGRYVAYRRGVHLPLVGLALVRVHAPEGLWKFLLP